MKRIVSLLFCFLAFTTISKSQVSRNRLKQPTYSWISRQVPQNDKLDSTFKSFHSIIDDGPAWSQDGDSVSTATAFIGPTTNQPLNFRTNNIVRGSFTSAGNFTVSNTSTLTGVQNNGNMVSTGTESVGTTFTAGSSVTTPSVYGPTSTSIINIFSNANGSGTINIGSGTGTVISNDPVLAKSTASISGTSTLTGLVNNGSILSTGQGTFGTNVIVNQASEPQVLLKVNGSTDGIFGNVSGTSYIYLSNATSSFVIYTGNQSANRALAISKDGNVAINRNTIASGDPTLNVIGTASISSTATLNGLTNLSNMTTTGTGSIGSTFTVTGAMKANSTLSVASTFTAGAGAVLQSTLTVGNTNTLTGGNTGTISVLDDDIFQVTFNVQNTTLNASTTYFMTTVYQYGWNVNGAAVGVYRIPQNCTLTNWTFESLNFTSNGSAGNSTLAVRANNSTDNNLSTTITFVGGTLTHGTNSTNYSAGDVINMKLITDSYTLAPVGVGSSCTLWFKRRL